ncbi:MAG TPA: beta-phosphoglucomutase [Spirochaetia bacterium]|nr:beta-phosphoglucomutase [Spirochaetia bacterium]
MDQASVYPVEPWKIREIGFNPSLALRNETVFALGNGNLGIRGSFEEPFSPSAPGTYLNGFYDHTPILYGEVGYGWARNRQVMLNVADARCISLWIDGEPFDLATGTLLDYERCLDLSEGTVVRSLRWRSPFGSELILRSLRLVSLVRPSVAAIEWAVTPVGKQASLVIESSIEGEVENRSSSDDPRVGAGFPKPPLTTVSRAASGWESILVQETRATRMALACAVSHRLEAGGRGAQVTASAFAQRAVLRLEARCAPGTPLRLVKYIAYRTTLDASRDSIEEQARRQANLARTAGLSALQAEQKEEVARFWSAADVRIEGDDALQQGLRFNLFCLFQYAGRNGKTSIAAKGLSGQGYEGHYFWDTEIYVFPFFLFTQPTIARSLLRYRVGILGSARARAAEMSQRGALFPWRTIGGEEASAYFPAGTAQYHIDADIAYAARQYVLATGDRGFLLDGGAELLFETARLWADLGTYDPQRDGTFRINEVTGPNEYSVLVDNNLYTNLMARENLSFAAEVARTLRTDRPDEYTRIAGALRLQDAEIEAWERAARGMRIPVDPARGIHAQDDSFLGRAPWDFERTPPDRYPLLLHYHYLVIYRHQVLKQPDVVLAQVLLGNRFTLAEKKRNFDYYDPLTTGDSSLSPCIQSVAAAELGYAEKAYEYFSRTARMDLDDVNGNVSDGVHTAAMAGTWFSVIRGFAGMRDYDARLSFAPRLPRSWNSLRFRLRFQSRLLEVTLTSREATYHLLEGEPLSILHEGRELRLEPERAQSLSLVPVLECVVFDLDGVLTDTAELHYQAWKRLSDEIGLPFDRTVNEELKGVGRQDSLRIILRHAGVSKDTGEVELLAEIKNGYYRELLQTITPARILPGMAELLRELRRRGIKTALASVSRNAAQILERLDIASSIDFVLEAGTVLKGKPDPEIFLRAAEGLGVPPRNCAGVEDARTGLQAIRAAGMFAVGIGADLPEAHWKLPDTRGLTADELGRRFLEYQEAALGSARAS